MSNNPTPEQTLHYFLFCPTCGQKRKLIDQKKKATEVGLSWPADLPAYTIECCGFELTIEDNATYLKVIEILKSE